MRSPTTPKVNSRPANTSVYELIAHSSWLWLAPRPTTGSAMVLSATFRTVLSSTIAIRLVIRTPSMIHRRRYTLTSVSASGATAEAPAPVDHTRRPDHQPDGDRAGQHRPERRAQDHRRAGGGPGRQPEPARVGDQLVHAGVRR